MELEMAADLLKIKSDIKKKIEEIKSQINLEEVMIAFGKIVNDEESALSSQVKIKRKFLEEE